MDVSIPAASIPPLHFAEEGDRFGFRPARDSQRKSSLRNEDSDEQEEVVEGRRSDEEAEVVEGRRSDGDNDRVGTEAESGPDAESRKGFSLVSSHYLECAEAASQLPLLTRTRSISPLVRSRRTTTTRQVYNSSYRNACNTNFGQVRKWDSDPRTTTFFTDSTLSKLMMVSFLRTLFGSRVLTG